MPSPSKLRVFIWLKAWLPQVLLAPLLVLLISLGLTYALWLDAKTTALQSLQTELAFDRGEIAERIRQRMLDYDQVLHSVRGLFAASKSVERDEFREYYAGLNTKERYPSIVGLGFIQQLPHAKKTQHLNAMRNEGFPDYSIHPEGDRELYTPTIYIEPFGEKNLRVFGFDAYSDPLRRTAMERARDANRTTITRHLALLQDNDQKASTGFLMVLPVYQNGERHETLAERRSHILGWVYASFRAEALMDGILGTASKDVDLSIFDGEHLSADTLLYASNKAPHANGQPDALLMETQKIEISGRTWTILVKSLPSMENRINTDKQKIIVQGGIAMSVLLSFVTWILTLGKMRSAQATQSLQHELKARKKAEESLRLAALVYENSSEGMLVTDMDNHIVAVNPAFTRITGYELDEILGKDPSIFSSGRHGPEFYSSMWDTLKKTGQWHGEIWDRRKNGEIHPKYLTINTIFNSDGSVYRRVALFLDISEKKQSEEFIWHQANFDALTKLPNRSMFQDRLEQDINKAQRNQLALALLFIDLDLFKEVNDTLGHHMGDLLLIEAAKRIASCVREVDTVARLGGDEFTVVLPGLHQDQNIERVAESILTRLAEPYHLGDEVVHITGSIGITLYPRDADNAEGLLKNADQAMYVAKNMGRNRFSYFTAALQESARTRLRLITDIREAIALKEFNVHYQPIVDLATGAIHKAEALIRWQHPKRGWVNPSEFIPLAEDTGLITVIGDWVFKEAARQAKRWRSVHHPDFQISVNKSPKQFRENEGSVTAWLDHLHDLDLPGSSITIEITEGLLLNAVSEVTDKLNLYRQGGVQIAIDDFGTGYSSLAYLKRFHIDYLKIDQSFVRDMETDPNDLALSQAIIVMAHALGLKVIAEGVETANQLKLLSDAGCDYAQGFLFSKALPADEFEIFLENRPMSIRRNQ